MVDDKSVFEILDELQQLKMEREQIMLALHDAIVSPKGVVPVTAEAFYDPVLALKCEDWRSVNFNA